MTRTQYMIALLVTLVFASGGSFAFADFYGSCCEGPRAITMPCPRPCIPEPPPPCNPCPPACHMPCCPPTCQPMQICCERTPCPPPLVCPPPCIDTSCYGDFYAGANAFRLDLSIGDECRGLGWDTNNRHRLQANMYGATVGFEYRKPFCVYNNLEFNWAIGRTHRQHRSCERGERFLHYYQAHWLLGYTFACGCESAWAFTPFAGLGYRYVDHHFTETGADLRYRTYYVPVGFRVDISCYKFMDIGIKAEWLFQVDPTVRTNHLQQVRFVLKKRQSYLIEVPLTYYFCCNQLELIISPFYRRFVDGPSERLRRRRDGIDMQLPRQVSQEWGGQVMIGFRF